MRSLFVLSAGPQRHQRKKSSAFSCQFITLWFAVFLFAVCLLFLLFNGNFSSRTTLAFTIEKENGTSLNASDDDPPSSSCIDDLSLLSHRIQSDQENYGMLPWSSTFDNNVRSDNFSGLDADLMTAFRGKRIFFWGDSTTKNLNLWLHNLLSVTDSSSQNISSLSMFKLSDANNIVMSESGCVFDPNKGGELSCKDKNADNLQTNLADGTTNRFMWTTVGIDNKKAYEVIKKHKPDILVANVGLWLLHFQAMGKSKPASVAEDWIGYEHWLQDTLAAAESAGVRVLLFKTTNRVCSEKYVGVFASANRLYSMKDNATIRGCFDDIAIGNTSTILKDEDIMNYCENGTFNDIGSAQLNQRLQEFVEVNRHNTSLFLHVFDDNAIKSCEYTSTSDGRHFHPLNLIRIRILAHLLFCIDLITQ